jgi:TRAP-type C4-dicarboxylate transport system permease small subunit
MVARSSMLLKARHTSVQLRPECTASATSALVAIIAAVVAYFAWRTAQNSAKATAALTEVERKRLQAEMPPGSRLSARLWTGVAKA